MTTTGANPGGARDRMRASAHPAFAENILRPIFEFGAAHHFYPLIDAHRAWMIMLAEQNIVPRPQAAQILHALDDLETAGPDAVRPFDPAVEFYYLHMERALVNRVPGGESIVGNLNLGRTRPEPLNRMVMRQRILGILKLITQVRTTLLLRADSEADTVMPGYTHLLHAQPTTLAHYLLAIHDHLARDTQRLISAYETTDQCTLGCGAMSGTSLPIDRNRVSDLLGFSRLCENTIDSVSASDHVTQSSAALASVMMIVGRVAQDLYIFSSQEYGMIDVTDAFASPSSLMPQKKNALVLEYIRSRTARAIGALTGTFAVLHNVGYMDTEEVELESYLPMFDSFEIVSQSLPTLDALLAAMQPNREHMRRRAAEGFSSVTALAEAIQTRKNVSYRTAHRIVARAVLLAVERNLTATGIDSQLLDLASQEMTGELLGLDSAFIANCLDPVQFVHHHITPGGPAPDEVRRMIAARQATLQSEQNDLTARHRRLDDARTRLRQTATSFR